MASDNFANSAQNCTDGFFVVVFFCPFGVMVTLKGHNELYSFLLYGKVQREESAKNSLFVFQGENNSFFFFLEHPAIFCKAHRVKNLSSRTQKCVLCKRPLKMYRTGLKRTQNQPNTHS